MIGFSGLNYYNDNDKFSVKWLRCLIESNLIPHGEVDDRSITEIKPAELKGFNQCHFFAGIGGWSYALALADWPRNRQVWTGSCPCQPFSVAGKGEGIRDDRHLWPAFRWLIAQCRPATVFGEQVASLDGREWLAGVRLDLEAMGYRFGAADLCAAGVGAPHIRQRLWWVADSNQQGKSWWGIQRPGKSFEACSGSACKRSSGFCANGGVAHTNRFNDDRTGHGTGDDGRKQSETKGLSGVEDFFGMADTIRNGRKERRNRDHGWNDRAESYPNGENDRLADPNSNGFIKERERITETWDDGFVGNGPAFWENSRIVICRDGKNRRIPAEPRFFPLADGLPTGTVGLLRGAGNAINPYVGAKFIEAFLSIQ